jgi:hypothetical protein
MRAKSITAVALLISAGAAVLFLWPKPGTPSPVAQGSLQAPTVAVAASAEEVAPLVQAPESTPLPEAAALPEPEPPAAPDPQADPKTALAEALRLFHEGEMETLFLNFIPPKAIAQMSEQKKAVAIEQLRAAQIPGTPGYELMRSLTPTLEAIQYTEPSYNEAGDRARYEINTFTPEGAPKRTALKMIRIDGRWYLD